jgi:AraC-like DNA-binding protein
MSPQAGGVAGTAVMDETPKKVGKIVFASDQLPAEHDDKARFSHWRDIYTTLYGAAEIDRIEERPFASRSEFMQIGDVGIALCAGTFGRYARTSRHVSQDTRGDFFIGFLRGRTRMAISQQGRDVVLAPGDATFYSNAEAYQNVPAGASISAGICVPRTRVLERVAGAEDLLARPLDPVRPAVRHLGRYLDFLLGCDEIAGDARLIERINTTLLDLVALSLGASGEVAQVAQLRGLRVARLQQVLTEIAAGFADPAFSPRAVAHKLGVTPRYLQKLLHDTGASFTERVLELRLVRARAMLADARNSRLKVSEIAACCGFNDISHFNHCFRRRFGGSPTHYRGAGAHGS